MRDRRLKRLPVTQAGRLIGIISRTDTLSVFCRPDESIRHEVIEGVVRGGFLVRSQPSGVIVHEGIVTLTGHPESDQVGRDLIQQVRHMRRGARHHERGVPSIRSGHGWSSSAVTVAAGTPGIASTTAAGHVPHKSTRSGKTSPSATT